jgi:hypothetical protein
MNIEALMDPAMKGVVSPFRSKYSSGVVSALIVGIDLANI